MYLNILKRDLKRKKIMNVIVMLFIILATMFVSSSINNIINVTSALDHYFEMANVPDYLIITMNKNLSVDIDKTINSCTEVDEYTRERIVFLTPDNITLKDNKKVANGGTQLLQSDISLNYFLKDGSKLENVKPGEIFITEGKANANGLNIGDKITFEINGVRNEFVLAGKIKDALFGSNQMGFTRYIISQKDYEKIVSTKDMEKYYGGDLIYLYSSNVDEMLPKLKPLINNSILTMNREFMEFCYIFDMIVVGILLVVSVILLIIAFVVLRFTISFTLSEEFREIGVMKAIGIGNFNIRSLYIIKYLGLSITGAIIGFGLSIPFGKMLRGISSQSIIIGNHSPFLVNAICALMVIGVVVLFCYSCTGKVKNMTPIDAIRNGQTGERFRKKSIMSLGKSKLTTSSFCAMNDIVSSPKRYSIITITFFLCISLLLILSITVSTMNSRSLENAFGWAKCDIYVDSKMDMECMLEDGHKVLEKHLEDMEKVLEENGMPALCYKEMMFSLPVSFEKNEYNVTVYHGTGSSMDMYEYTAGTAPQNTDEIAITRIVSDKLNAKIGDMVTIKTIDGSKDYIISAYFQSMNMQGEGIRLHNDEEINYIQAQGCLSTQIMFKDNPDKGQIKQRVEKIKRLFPNYEKIQTCEEAIVEMVGVANTLEAVKKLIVILTIILTSLITVLMERSFIAKEKGEIAFMKAIGVQNKEIYMYHTLRFIFVGIIAVILGEMLAIPLTHLFIDPIFKMMGMELAVEYVINFKEMCIVFPFVILLTTCISAYVTSLYTSKIKSSDTANIE